MSLFHEVSEVIGEAWAALIFREFAGQRISLSKKSQHRMSALLPSDVMERLCFAFDYLDVPTGKLELQTEEIVRLRKKGITVQQIAKRLNISRRTVYKHLQNKSVLDVTLGKPKQKSQNQLNLFGDPHAG